MALRQIRTYGDPVLEKKCREIKEVTPRIRELIGDMLETMHAEDGVGLAAPQVGVLRRLVVIDVTGVDDDDEEEQGQESADSAQAAEGEQPMPRNTRPDGTQVPRWEGPLVMINPEILETWGEQEGSEGCLSVPGKAGKVTRPNYVRARAMNENMEAFEVEGTGLLARAICHELDHLDGIMYVTRVEGELFDVGDDEEEDT